MAYPALQDLHSHSRRMLVLGALLAMLLLAVPGRALAAPPPNDAFAAAELLTGTTATASGSNREATKETGEPNHRGITGRHSIWYRWVAPFDGLATIDTNGSSFSSAVAVYTGLTVDGLSAISSDNALAWNQTVVRIPVTAGRVYMIAVDGWDAGDVKLHLAAGPSPSNDSLANAQRLTGEQASATGDNTNASREPGEPAHAAGVSGRSVWYAWTAPYTGAATVDTAGSAFNTTLAVYTGGEVASLAPVASNNDADNGATDRSRVTFRAEEGVTYRIAVDGYWSPAYGRVAINLALRALPENDLFANATELLGDAYVVAVGRTDGASAEPGEPSHYNFNPAARSVWYSWTPPHSGSVTIQASGLPGTVLAAYTGDGVAGLSRVANQAQHGNPGPSQIRVRVSAGVTYRIAVDTQAATLSGGGEFTLILSLIDSPPNDDFADAQLIEGLSVDIDGTNVGATQEPGEPMHDDNYYDPSVWYTWTAPATGGVRIDLGGSKLMGVVGVYTGDSVGALSRVPLTRNTTVGPAKRSFRAVGGVTYRIAVDGAQALQGPFHMSLRWRPPPSNDMFAAAEPLVDGADAASGDNMGATGENGEPNAGGTAGASVWYRWTASSTGLAVLNTPTSDFAAAVGVYTGVSPDALTAVTRAPVAGEGFRFRAVAGTTYQIAVHGGTTPQRGTFTVSLRTLRAPPNDDLANAETLEGDSDSADGTTDNSTREPGEPGSRSGSSVWYRWTAPSDRRTVVTVPTASFDAAVDVYTGDRVSALTAVAPADQRSLTRFAYDATHGVTYWIRVDSPYQYETGTFGIRLVQGDPPPNDNFADATVLTGSRDEAAASTVFAGREQYESTYPSSTSGSVWYRWRAPAGGTVTIDTFGSDFDTFLAAWTGTSLSRLTPVTDNNDYGGGPQSRISFIATAGQVYRLRVDGPGSASGIVALHLRFASSPPNDDFAHAVALSGASPVADGTNVGAVKEPGEPLHAGDPGGASVWYRWTAPADGTLGLSTSGSQFAAVLGVYTGDAVGGLTEAGSGSTDATVDVSSGTTYAIAVDGSNPDREGPREGALRLTLSFAPEPEPEPAAPEPPAEEAAPTEDPAAPQAEETPPAEEAAPAEDQAAPQAQETPPAEEAAPAEDPAAPQAQETPPAEEAAPAEEPAAPTEEPALAPPEPASEDATGSAAPGDVPFSDPASVPPLDVPADPPADPTADPAVPPEPEPDASPPKSDPSPPADPEPTSHDPAGLGEQPAADPPIAGPPAEQPPTDEPAVTRQPPAEEPPPTDAPEPQQTDLANPAPAQPRVETPTKPTPRLWYKPSAQRLGSAMATGLAGTFSCSSECSVEAHVAYGNSTTHGSAHSKTGAPKPITLRLPRKLRRARSARLTVRMVARIDGQTVRLTRHLTIRR
jgi:hypothetical protein